VNKTSNKLKHNWSTALIDGLPKRSEESPEVVPHRSVVQGCQPRAFQQPSLDFQKPLEIRILQLLEQKQSTTGTKTTNLKNFK
jgi:hypothetical protein